MFTKKVNYAIVAASEVGVHEKPSSFLEERAFLKFANYYKILGKSPEYYDLNRDLYNWLQILLPDGKIGYIRNFGIQESEDPEALLRTGYLSYPSQGWIRISDRGMEKFDWKEGKLKPEGFVPKISLGTVAFDEITRSLSGEIFYRVIGGTEAFSPKDYSITEDGYKFRISSKGIETFPDYLSYSMKQNCWRQPKLLTEAILRDLRGTNIDLCLSEVKSYILPIGRVFYIGFFLRSPDMLPGNISRIRTGVGRTISDYIFIPTKDGYYSEKFHNKELQWIDFDMDGTPEIFVKSNITRVNPPSYSVYKIESDRLISLFEREVSYDGCSKVQAVNRRLIYTDACKDEEGEKSKPIREIFVLSGGKFVKE
ncbi:hypothetical protein EHQ27_15565 [Leptospira wolffii]|uniref:hypothetical protein n=1 Tax=Leptospira wolffii TaxID=409998 RepID=UPI001083A95A|nr:hypothetical protein [Leptospira wolffii]TGK61871.1 hypothetical protein EHQ32_03200 [Leptospira wolffii]TGK67507.1 hypothetical protein EHQ27_15565 [Leptospira wolffii]TGK74745.1 hypothetical protein EHQ35_10580 [Leptospira wolffii]TGL31679.1 hypothetical protein EHQ57_02095 [Leptospira wolffii]